MHKLLARQLRRKAAIGNDAQWKQALTELAALAGEPWLPPQAAQILDALPALFAEVDNTYSQFDRDLELRRRSLEVSSAELMHLNQQLRAEAAGRQRALDTLRDAANQLLRGAGLPELSGDNTNLESLSSVMARLMQEREAAQLKLGESESRLVLALSVTDSVAWDWDIVRNKMVVISTGNQVLGFPRERIEDDPTCIGELVGREGGARLREKLIEHLRGEVPEFKYGLWMTIREGERRFMQFDGKVVARGDNGRALRMAGIMHDLTANKRTEEALRLSEARFRSLTALSSDWYWEQDDQFRFTATQGETDARAGITADAHVQRTRWELPHTYPVGFTWDEHRAVLARHEPFRDLVIKREVPGEAVRYVSVSGAPIFDTRGRFTGYRGVAKDVTERVRAEEALRQSQMAAQEATRAKSEFLANMSHEIRTPMNGMLGMTELLLGTRLTSKQRHFAETARRSGEALLTLINDILDFSKIEAGKMAIDRVEFSLRDMLEDVTQLLAESAASKGLELVCRLHRSAPGVAVGDPTRVRQVLINLIGNAIKFTERGEVVTELRVANAARDGRRHGRVLVFEVRDTGIGIAPEAQANIFVAFNQADGSTTRHYGGTGLGLAICRQLVELMGGELSLKSTPGEGSTFRFTLPCEKVSQPQRPRDLPVMAALLVTKRLLIVDDHAASRDTLRELVRREFGMYCDVAANGIEALQLAREARQRGEPFDVAMFDADMPTLDGMALAGAFRADARLAATRLLFVTAVNRAGDMERVRAAGFAATLSKPVRRVDLLRALMLAFDADPGAVSQKLHAAAVSQRPLDAGYTGTVLVAEDNPVNQQVVRAVLESCGLTVRIAHNGREAVQAVQQASFDLIFMDCQMPELDGYMATRAIRAFELEAGGTRGRTPIVALTAHATQADRERCLNAGMDSYVSKPFTQAILLGEIERWLSPRTAAPAVAPPTELATRTQRLDMRALRELSALDPDDSKGLLRTLANTYVQHTRALLVDLAAAVEREDEPAIGRETHKLKSGSMTMGAARVGKLAHAMEQASHAGDMTRCRALMPEILVEFDHAQQLLLAELQTASKAA